jgi:hypothetical protein
LDVVSGEGAGVDVVHFNVLDLLREVGSGVIRKSLVRFDRWELRTMVQVSYLDVTVRMSDGSDAPLSPSWWYRK